MEIGRQQARDIAALLKQITFHRAYGSPLQRAKETLEIILKDLRLGITPSYHHELKERNWGDVDRTVYGTFGNGKYTREEAETWFTWTGKARGGESYEDMSKRIVPFFERNILPQLKAGRNVLVVAHNGISKPLQRHLESIPHESVHTLDLKNCEVRLYEFDETGVVKKIESRISDHTN